MKESEYAPIILETIGSNGASIRTLKTIVVKVTKSQILEKPCIGC